MVRPLRPACQDWRLPKAETARAEFAVTVGADGFTLLEAVYAAEPKTPAWLRHVDAVQTLRVVWVQQYYRDQQGLRWRDNSELPPGASSRGVCQSSGGRARALDVRRE